MLSKASGLFADRAAKLTSLMTRSFNKPLLPCRETLESRRRIDIGTECARRLTVAVAAILNSPGSERRVTHAHLEVSHRSYDRAGTVLCNTDAPIAGRWSHNSR